MATNTTMTNDCRNFYTNHHKSKTLGKFRNALLENTVRKFENCGIEYGLAYGSLLQYLRDGKFKIEVTIFLMNKRSFFEIKK